MIPRLLANELKKSKKNILLLGPRQTGKSTLLKTLAPTMSFNLASEDTYFKFIREPAELEHIVTTLLKHHPKPTIFIDEIQRIPRLLNSVQALVDDNSNLRFFLSGSSARKLRRGKANLLPGRIHSYHLGPLSILEMEETPKIENLLSFGCLPGIFLEHDEKQKRKTLKTYATTYLKEEIQAEALTRSIEGFARFLSIIGTYSGKYLDLSKVASEARVPRQSASNYFEIIEDTLIANRCPAFSKSKLKRLIQHPKFFLFDCGVLNGLLGNFQASPDRIGNLFENFIFTQLLTTAYAMDEDIEITNYRTEHGAEVDFIVEYRGRVWAIEAKASQVVGKSDLSGFQSFSGFYKRPHEKRIVYFGSTAKSFGGVDILPWKNLFDEIFL